MWPPSPITNRGASPPAKLGVSSTVAVVFGLGARTLALSIYDGYIRRVRRCRTVRGLEEIAKEAKFGARFRAFRYRRVSKLTKLTGTITALGRMTETRDPYTASGRIPGVGLAEKIALQSGLDARSAGVHSAKVANCTANVGKIARARLGASRPNTGKAPLISNKFEMIKRHPSLGSDILSKASISLGLWPRSALQPGTRAADGSVWSAPLRGSEIILPARIIALPPVVVFFFCNVPIGPGLGLDVAHRRISPREQGPKVQRRRCRKASSIYCVRRWIQFPVGDGSSEN